MQSIAVADEPVCWRALVVRAGSERQACIWLKRRQLDPYWPRYDSKSKLRSRRRYEFWKSVIPGYLFLPIPRLLTISSDFFQLAPDIWGFMRNGSNNVVEIKVHEIDQIRSIEEALRLSAIAAVEGIPFKVGQVVRVTRLGVKGRVLKIESRAKLVVEVPMFGGQVPTTLPASEIEAAS